MSRLLIFLFFIAAVLPGSAQDFRYTLRNYKAVDGLPQSQVTALAEDKNGYLWLGTEGGGLARFDGRNFKVYTTADGMQSNFIRFLMFDSHDNLWIMHPRGLSRFNGATFRKFEQPPSRKTNPAMRRIVEFQDSIIFISAPEHIGKIYKDSVYYWDRPVAQAITGKPAPVVWFARRVGDALVFCIDGEYLRVHEGKSSYTVSFGSTAHKLSSTFVYRDELWIVVGDQYLRLDRGSRTIVTDHLPLKHSVRHYDPVNDVFWTQAGPEVFTEKITGDSVRVRLVTKDISVSVVAADSEGATWLGSNGQGLFKYYVQDFELVPPAEPQHVMAIHVANDGAIWTGSASEGLFRTAGGKVKQYPLPPGLRSQGVTDITKSPDGKLYVAASAGLGIYNRQTDTFSWTAYGHENRMAAVFNVQFDDQGGMWVGTAGAGLFHIVNGDTVNYSASNGLNSDVIMASQNSRYHKAHYVSDDFGLYEIKSGKVRLLAIDNAAGTSVINIQPFQDSLLLLSTTGSGVILYKPGNGWKKTITTRDGLGSDFIYFAGADNEGYIWVGSEKGITRISLDAAYKVTGHLHYDYDNGLAGVETNQNAFFFNDKIRLFGLVDGLYQFNNHPYSDEGKFRTHLTGVEVFYGEVPVLDYAASASGFYHIPEKLSLPHDKNHITFRFNKVNKSYPKAIKFQHILEGFDRAWSRPSQVTEATYGNLPPGKFTFKVMSSDIYGNWSNEVLSYTFTVEAPFYARTGFIVAAVLLAAALLSAFLYWRVRNRITHMLMLERVRRSEQDKVRKDIARDFHDEMGNQLTRIIHYVSLLKLNGSANGKTDYTELYGKVEQSAKYLFNGTRDFIWSIDPSNDELCQLFLHIRDFGEKLFEEKNIGFRATKTIRDAVKLPYGFSREANLIFKEAMTNAFKYSQAKNVTLALTNDRGMMQLVFEDDGVGFDRRNCTGDSCRGLKNMEERARKLNAAFTITTGPGSGTRIVLEFITQKNQRYGVTV